MNQNYYAFAYLFIPVPIVMVFVQKPEQPALVFLLEAALPIVNQTKRTVHNKLFHSEIRSEFLAELRKEELVIPWSILFACPSVHLPRLVMAVVMLSYTTKFSLPYRL